MKKKILYLCVAVVMTVSSCGGKEIRKEDLAAQAAKSYYDSLLAGDYEYFARGFVGVDSVPPHYLEQLMVNAKQYVHEQKETHGGVSGVEIIGAKSDTALCVTNVFLLLCFADSVKEEIVVPMVEMQNGGWLMK